MKISDIENTQDFLISVSFLVESVYFSHLPNMAGVRFEMGGAYFNFR